MDWFQVLTIVASTVGCCLYFRRETKVQLDKMEAHGRVRDEENKDFHARLCVIEERYLQVIREQSQMMKEQSEIRTLMYQSILQNK